MLGEYRRSQDVRRRTGIAIVLAAAVFWLDLHLPAGFPSGLLYVPLVLLLYGALRPATFIAFAVGCLALIALGALAQEGPSSDLAASRAGAAAVVALVALLIWRLSHAADLVRLLTTTDPLTGAYTRDYFLELVAGEQRRAARYRTAYSILLVDVDHLRDAFSRGIGTLALQTVASVCKTMLRPTDMLARYGDEAFIIALTHTPERGAIVTAQRVRDALASIALPTISGELSFASSIGVSSYRGRVEADDILTGADHARRLAKSNGRNRVCVDHGPDAPPMFA